MRYLTLGEVVVLHRAILAQPRATFGEVDLHPTLAAKAAALILADA